MATDNMSAGDVSKATAKQSREEIKKKQFEQRLELEQRRDVLRRRGRRLMKAGFGVIAFGFLSTVAYSYYSKPSLIQSEMENLKNIIMMRPTSGPKS